MKAHPAVKRAYSKLNVDTLESIKAMMDKEMKGVDIHDTLQTAGKTYNIKTIREAIINP